MSMEFSFVVVEGDLDAVVAKRLLRHLDIASPEPINKRGGANFWADAAKYDQAARNGSMVFGLVDLEGRNCASGLLAEKLPLGRHTRFVVRIARRMVESWLLADIEGISSFLGIARNRLGFDPESLPNPKRKIVDLARTSRKRRIKEALVPEEGMSGIVGKEYSTTMKLFVEKHWDPDRAYPNSPSLRRAVAAIRIAFQR